MDSNSDNIYEVSVSVTDHNGLFDLQNLLVQVEDGNDIPYFSSFEGRDLADSNQIISLTEDSNISISLEADYFGDDNKSLFFSILEGIRFWP